jgi:uncharacterized protein (TIGR04255 family)
MGQKLSNAPVYFTMAQVKFNAFLNIDERLVAIQVAFSKIGFPDFKSLINHQISIGVVNGMQFQHPPVQGRWWFGDVAGNSGFILENNALSFQTTDYGTFELFLASFMKGVEIIRNTLSPPLCDRIGLRYLDAILPERDKPLSFYLVPEVLGLAFKINNSVGGDEFQGESSTLQHSFSETLTKSKSGHTLSRVIIQDGGVGLPPELAVFAPPLNIKFKKFTGRHAILDADAFIENRMPFELNKIEKALDDLKLSITHTFNVTVTADALSFWS